MDEEDVSLIISMSAFIDELASFCFVSLVCVPFGILGEITFDADGERVFVDVDKFSSIRISD